MAKTLIELNAEKAQIVSWLKDNKYILDNISSGEWDETDVRYLEYLSQKSIKRNDLLIIQEQIKVLA